MNDSDEEIQHKHTQSITSTPIRLATLLLVRWLFEQSNESGDKIQNIFIQNETLSEEKEVKVGGIKNTKNL